MLLLLLLAHPAGAATLSKPVYDRLQKIHQHMDHGHHAQALTELEKLLPDVQRHKYEKAVVLQTLGYAHIGQDHYDKAIHAFSQALALDSLPDAPRQQLRYSLGQLYLATDQPQPALDILRLWLKTETTPNPAGYAMLGNAHARLKQYRDAIPLLEKAIRLAEKPEESWYQLLLGMHYELQDHAACIDVLKQLLLRYPQKPAYWTQLAGMHLARDDYRQALSVMELAWLQGHIDTSRDLVQLARLYTHQGIPWKAGQLLSRELDKGRVEASGENLALLATVWHQARERERAIAAYHKALAIEARADLEMQLAQLYLEDENWQQAADLLESALRRPDLENPGQAWLLLGVARYELNAPGQARQAFAQARTYDGVRKTARQWLAHLDAGA